MQQRAASENPSFYLAAIRFEELMEKSQLHGGSKRVRLALSLSSSLSEPVHATRAACSKVSLGLLLF